MSTIHSELVLTSLPGTRGKVTAGHFSSVDAAFAMVRRGRKYSAVSMAGQNGSVNVWRADDGLWYGECDVHRMPIEERAFNFDRAKAAQWLRKAYKACQ
jgi:hypothetical protein